MKDRSARLEREIERFLGAVGSNVRAARRSLGSQQEIAKRLRLDGPALSRIEHGANITLASLFLVARGLGVDPAALVTVPEVHEP